MSRVRDCNPVPHQDHEEALIALMNRVNRTSKLSPHGTVVAYAQLIARTGARELPRMMLDSFNAMVSRAERMSKAKFSTKNMTHIYNAREALERSIMGINADAPADPTDQPNGHAETTEASAEPAATEPAPLDNPEMPPAALENVAMQQQSQQ